MNYFMAKYKSLISIQWNYKSPINQLSTINWQINYKWSIFHGHPLQGPPSWFPSKKFRPRHGWSPETRPARLWAGRGAIAPGNNWMIWQTKLWSALCFWNNWEQLGTTCGVGSALWCFSLSYGDNDGDFPFLIMMIKDVIMWWFPTRHGCPPVN